MTYNIRRQKGSVVVMAIGLLVLLAMIGGTFIIVAFLDRRESHGLTVVAPMRKVAQGVVDSLARDRLDRLCIGAGDVMYGAATSYKSLMVYPYADTATPTANPAFYDRLLSSFAPVEVKTGLFKWRHVSDLQSTPYKFASNVMVLPEDPPTDPPTEFTLVDSDNIRNDGTNERDCKLWPSNIFSYDSGDLPEEQGYYVGVRLIDAGGLLNVNTAYGAQAATANTPMPVVNVGMDAFSMTDSTVLTAIRDALHNARTGKPATAVPIATYNTNWVTRPLKPVALSPPYLPFDSSDLLAFLGGAGPSTATGRLYAAYTGAGGVYTANLPKYVTTWSVSRDYVRRTGVEAPAAPADVVLPANQHRYDINTAVQADLFRAFYNMIPAGIAGLSDDDNTRRKTAAQLTVNILDYRDALSDVTVMDYNDATGAKVGTVYGVERQPFITEAWLWMKYDADTSAVIQHSAIELYNPYKTDISLAGYALKVGAGAITAIAGLPATLPSNGRLVLYSSTEIRTAASSPPAVQICQVGALNLRETCTLYRLASAGPIIYVPIGQVPFAEFGLTAPTDPNADPVFCAIRRDDEPTRARYSVAKYKHLNTITYHIGDATCPAAVPDTSNLGRANGVADNDAETTGIAPTPVFVRNGTLINLGEALRAFSIGPTLAPDTPLDVKLAATGTVNSVFNGRLNPLYLYPSTTTPVPVEPATTLNPYVPPACMLDDFFAVLKADVNNTGGTDCLYGKININTASWQVIASLPGISTATDSAGVSIRDRIAKEIVAYRDGLDNSAGGNGNNYNYGPTHYDTPNPTYATPKYDSTKNDKVRYVKDTGITGLRESLGFSTAGEIMIPILRTPGLKAVGYAAAAPNAYSIADASASDDGLVGVVGDGSKYLAYYSWLSNQITVRSDVFIAFIRVQLGWGTDNAVCRRYVAVIDRSNCRALGVLPTVTMFAEMK